MFGDLQGLGWGLVVFAILLVVGTLVLYNFGGAVGCGYPNTATFGVYSFNATAGACSNVVNATQLPLVGSAYSNINFVTGQLGSTGGGLASWTPAIIAISVGLLFLGAFLGGKGSGKKGRY